MDDRGGTRSGRPRRLLQVGFGAVGRAFAELVAEKRDDLAARGLDLRVVAVATSRGLWRTPDEADVDAAAGVARRVSDGASFATLPGVHAGIDGIRAIGSVAADILVEATATNLVDGEPGTAHLRAALARGMSAASAGKGALVHHYAELRDLAAANGARLRYGAATAAALPTVDLAEFGLAGARIERVDGVLNGTSNLILTLMQRNGVAYGAALAEAQARGIAEADPSLDVDGWDTAAKLVLIANAIWDTGLRLADVERTGIATVGDEAVRAATAHGRMLRLLGSAWRAADGRPRARVGPEALAMDHPMAHVDGAEKGATFTTDTMGRVTISGGASSPRGAAAALLRDVIHLAR